MIGKGMAKGLILTLKYALTKKSITVEYPHEVRESLNMRGMHKLDRQKCIVCRMCAISCPNGSITIKLKEGREKTKNIEDYDYIVSIGECLFCGMCEEACPKDALELTGEFELSEYKREELMKNLSGEVK